MSAARCHTPGRQEATVRPPWADDPRADAKDALLAYVRQNAYGVPIIHAARAVLDPDAEAGDADHRLALRFYTDDHAHLFKIARRDGLRWVEPRDVAHLLTSSRRNPSPPDTDSANRPTGAGFLPARAPAGRAAGTARSVLRDRGQITPGPAGEGVRAALVHALAAHRQGVDTDGMRSDRVSDPSRVAATQGAYLRAFEAAAARYHTGAFLTLTARPGESGDMVDSAVAVSESIGPLRDHLARQVGSDGRPPAVVVPEVTRRGVVHLHAVVFGVSPDGIDRDALSRYWHETRGHGYITDAAPVERRAGRWVFADHATADTARGRFVRSYLGDTLFSFRAVAEASPEELHAGAVPGAWKVALLWACGLPLCTVSTALRESSARISARGGRPRVSMAVPRSRSRSRSAALAWPLAAGVAGLASGVADRSPVRRKPPPEPPPRCAVRPVG